MGSYGLLNDLVMHGQQPQRAGFVSAHLAAKTDDVGEHDGGQVAGVGRRGLGWVLFHGGDYPTGSSRLSTGADRTIPVLHPLAIRPVSAWHFWLMFRICTKAALLTRRVRRAKAAPPRPRNWGYVGARSTPCATKGGTRRLMPYLQFTPAR